MNLSDLIWVFGPLAFLIALFARRNHRFLKWMWIATGICAGLGFLLAIAVEYAARILQVPGGGSVLLKDSDLSEQYVRDVHMVALIIWGWYSLPLILAGLARLIRKLTCVVIRRSEAF